MWSLQDCLRASFKETDLFTVSLSLSEANNSCIEIVGALFVRLCGISTGGNEIYCATMVYVSPSADGFFLSLEAMVDLDLINRDSPIYPAERKAGESVSSSQQNGKSNGGEVQTVDAGPCQCPKQTGVPDRPRSLPFSAEPENNSRMKAWLLETFSSSSTFNTCPHQSLPALERPAIKIHIDKTPKACHTPASIPLHWQEKVHLDQLRDEVIGVIEKVPYGEPVTWCHRMVVTRKHEGSPRRTVDLSPLNKHCKRETFASESPFQIIHRIRRDTWKTVTDAWIAYHGVPLEETYICNTIWPVEVFTGSSRVCFFWG